LTNIPSKDMYGSDSDDDEEPMLFTDLIGEDIPVRKEPPLPTLNISHSDLLNNAKDKATTSTSAAIIVEEKRSGRLPSITALISPISTPTRQQPTTSSMSPGPATALGSRPPTSAMSPTVRSPQVTPTTTLTVSSSCPDLGPLQSDRYNKARASTPALAKLSVRASTPGKPVYISLSVCCLCIFHANSLHLCLPFQHPAYYRELRSERRRTSQTR
jgi:hypothetical protein